MFVAERHKTIPAVAGGLRWKLFANLLVFEIRSEADR
jgi:hypothetical protein